MGRVNMPTFAQACANVGILNRQVPIQLLLYLTTPYLQIERTREVPFYIFMNRVIDI